MSESERINFDAMIKAAKQKAAAEKEAAQKAAADLAYSRYNKAAVNSGSIIINYLLRKRLIDSNYDVKVDENQALILPIRDLVAGNISSLQTIQDDGQKRFMSGGQVKGMGLILGSLSTVDCFTLSDLKGLPRVAVSEGAATAMTVRDALGCPVVIAFSSGNIPAAAALIRTHLPDIDIIVCGDIGNGQDKAEQAAKLVKGLIVLPTGKDGTDFNDDFVAGLNAGLSRDDSLAAIRERIESQIKGDSLPVVMSDATTVMDDDKRPIVLVNNRDLREIANDAEKLIAGDTLVFAESGKRLIKLLDDGERLPITKHGLRDIAMSNARFMREKKDKEGNTFLVPDNLHLESCEMVLSRGQWGSVRVLNGVTASSLIMTDGRVIASAGYDDVSGIYALSGGCYPSISDKVSHDDALGALAVLYDLLKEFDFDTPEDASAAMSLLISSLLRPVMRTCPMFLVNAATFGSGKTALAQVAAIIATGKKADATPWTGKPEELEKRLLSLSLAGLPVAFFDNLMGDLHDESGAFAAFLTSEFYSGRVLGESRMVGAKTKMLMLATGNNVTPLADMARRTIAIRLTPDCENPEARTFSRDLEDYVIKHREQIIKSVLTLVKGYFDAGCPVPAGMSKAGSFSDWEKLARLPLLWLGVVDPWLVVGRSQAVDPDKLALGALLSAITRRGWGLSPFNAGQVASENAFIEIMPDDMKVRGEVNLRKWGKWFGSKVDVIVDGLKLVKAPIKTDGKNWFIIESVKTV
jgi:hypothetical protein